LKLSDASSFLSDNEAGWALLGVKAVFTVCGCRRRRGCVAIPSGPSGAPAHPEVDNDLSNAMHQLRCTTTELLIHGRRVRALMLTLFSQAFNVGMPAKTEALRSLNDGHGDSCCHSDEVNVPWIEQDTGHDLSQRHASTAARCV